MSRFIAVLVLILGTAACGSHESVVPVTTGASPTAPIPSPKGLFMRGTVYDTAFRPLAGARVEVVDGPQAGLSTSADTKGEFSLTGAFDDATRFRATKEGHVAAIKTLQPFCAACDPHWWINFSLDVLAPPVNIAGDYTLTFIADSACAANLPNEMRTRSYGATITPWSSTSFSVAVSGAPFFSPFNWFSVGVAGNYLGFWLGDEHVVEQLAANAFLSFSGAAEASVATSGVSTISASLDGVIDYCVLKSAVGQPYACSSSQALTHAQCESKNHQMILTRR